MPHRPRDAAPKRGNGKRVANGADHAPLTEAQVAGYLRRHPEFLARNPELLDVLKAPMRDCGEGVVDLQHYLVERLRRDLAEMTAARDALVVAGRDNLSAQARVHKAILGLLAARSFAHFIEVLTTDLAIVLDVDAVTIGVEQTEDNLAHAGNAGVVRLEPNTVDAILGPNQHVSLRANIEGDPEIFGAAAGLVASEALMRLSISGATPAALLALGSRQPEKFHPGQACELLNFLTRVVETSIRGWLNLPD